MDPYLTLKWLHILSSTVLFGTGIGTAFQMLWAWRSQRIETIHSVASGVVVADCIFTTPAGFVQPLTGYLLIREHGHDWNEPWLLWTYALYAIAFICWAPVVHLQIRHTRSRRRGAGRWLSAARTGAQAFPPVACAGLAALCGPDLHILADGQPATVALTGSNLRENRRPHAAVHCLVNRPGAMMGAKGKANDTFS